MRKRIFRISKVFPKLFSSALPPPFFFPRKRHSSRTLNRASRICTEHGVSPRVGKFFERSFPSIHNCCAVVCVGMRSRGSSRAARFLRESRSECKTSIISVTSNRRCHPRSTRLALPSFSFLYTKLSRKGRRGRSKRGGNIYARAPLCTYCIGNDNR